MDGGRILKEADMWKQVNRLEFEERKAELKRVTGFLEVLAEQEVLQRSVLGFSYTGRDRLFLEQT